jgi:DNA-binding Lrp family transcriptional regulator
VTLDEIDRRILEVLQREGRISNQDLADRVGLSPSPCLRRLRQLERGGVIERYAALLSPPAAGYGLNALIEVRLDRQRTVSVERFEREILKHPQVLECDLLAGEWDFILRVVAKDLDEFREFCVNTLSKIPGVGNVRSSISMKRVKYSTVLPLGQLRDPDPSRPEAGARSRR